MAEYKWLDDDGKPVKATSAEQHALDNPGHVVRAQASWDSKSNYMILNITCGTCPPEILDEGPNGEELTSPGWWDQQGMPPVKED